LTLYLIPTVLAPETTNSVLSPQIKEVISQTNYYFVENIRTARRFISELKLGKVIDSLHFFLLDKDTSLVTIQGYYKQIPPNENIGVISEAGCPGIADPGALAVQQAHKQGIAVVPLVGPSSILLALMGSGFSGQSFVFHGYLPIDKAERSKHIKVLEKEALQKKQTQIFMETPFRNKQLLDDILANCRNDTLLCIAANLTAPDQLLKTMPIAQWKKQQIDIHKKPCIFLIG
jgi:16S rRNA (cytidine1402-2'-O)-methyltransferase